MADGTVLRVAPAIYKHEMDKSKHIASTHYLQLRRDQVREQIAALQLEEQAIDHILGIMTSSVCKCCNGHGQYWIHTAHDDGYWHSCTQCKGTGRIIPKAE